jgi:1,4-dihydroxy-2-naphthoyl-CoA synthase
MSRCVSLNQARAKGVLELLRVFQEALGDLAIRRVLLQGEVRREHDRAMTQAFDMRIGHGASGSAVLGTHCTAPAGLRVCSHS